MIVRASPLVAALANVVAWAVFHSTTGYLAHRLPVRRLARDGVLLRIRPWERGGRAWDRVGVRRWKDALPEAGALFAGGVSKRRLASTSRDALARFAVETRRAELAHWWAMACGPLAAAWNPPVGTVAMVAYGVLANAPFIVVQRYNRARLLRVLERSRRSTSSTADATGSAPRRSGSSIP